MQFESVLTYCKSSPRNSITFIDQNCFPLYIKLNIVKYEKDVKASQICKIKDMDGKRELKK